MIRIVGPVESEMYKKYPATKWIAAPRPIFAVGPKVFVEAVTTHAKKAAEFVKTEHAMKLAFIAEQAQRKYEEAQKTLRDACDEFCAAERAVIDEQWKQRNADRKASEALEQVEVEWNGADQNWVDEVLKL